LNSDQLTNQYVGKNKTGQRITSPLTFGLSNDIIDTGVVIIVSGITIPVADNHGPTVNGDPCGDGSAMCTAVWAIPDTWAGIMYAPRYTII